MRLSEDENYFEIEEKLLNEGYRFICGVDEAGRGPLAGPVFAAAVVMDRKRIIEGVRDSKKLTPKKREKLFEEIIKESIAYSVAMVDSKVIDEININNATFLAMKNAIENLKIEPDIVLVDGYKIPNLGFNQRAIIKGDRKSYSIACASILAKVSRDRYIVEISSKYPLYKFEKHKGYGTKEHIEILQKYGPCEIHRISFLKNILSL
ncbi:RNase HII [Caldicellulosiruptor bescii]|uniref:Ribonuclease HII n=2 Tax=Caldicellulosiruptor bescii TaxID=31899 RepID=RNH2_CALBD|nr:ribonuclease HII [Caldicellulosiruptor bescii]B9MQX2.1 RecName: Full=Ribonuclease HII; Short=RNase HII [Caldicellulosiruptor bescii DSM 6725]ACM60076.1 Ribonuclease H [Caldicellulosiruptor bescii DSM 6725]PBC87490.1 RNase HII [Caldicellulosiruptor bescii]PBC90423.1 RNase HII [Caldicellulosiruptor bescii]PBD04145.1 RNase HII [Caldicellulosiruptor bescii]PBD06220.1 RNase HII [Caldicellulosiruptor bescii]